MVSKAIASLDAWLARAEEVLAEQREHAISALAGVEWDPSQELDDRHPSRDARLRAVRRPRLERPLHTTRQVDSDCGGERPASAFGKPKPTRTGPCIAEVVSNNYLPPNDQWTPPTGGPTHRPWMGTTWPRPTQLVGH